MSSVFEAFVDYCLFTTMARQVATNLFYAKSEATIKAYIHSAKMIQMQAYITGQEFDPLSAVSVINVLQSVPELTWTANTFANVRRYLSFIYDVNGLTLDPLLLLVIQGLERQNLVEINPRPPRPVMTPAQYRNMILKIMNLPTGFYKTRTLLALTLSFYTVGRAFDLTHLQGGHLEFGPDYVRLHYQKRKNNSKCPLIQKKNYFLTRNIIAEFLRDKVIGTVFRNNTKTCPFKIIVRSVLHLHITGDTFLMHKKNRPFHQMKAASLINSLKNVQEQANSSPVMTLTDVRASAVSALGKARIQTNALLAWGGWSSNMLRVNKILENISLFKIIISHNCNCFAALLAHRFGFSPFYSR